MTELKIADSVISNQLSFGENELSSSQLATSQLFQSIFKQVTDQYMLAGMVTGGIFASATKAYCSRFLSSVSFFQKSPYGNFALQGFSTVTACMTEAVGMHSLPELLRGTPTIESKFGEGLRGWAHTTLTIMLMKTTGAVLPVNNVAIQHFSQDVLMVGLDSVCAVAGLTEAAQGNFCEKVFNNEVVSWQMMASGSLVRQVAPAVAIFEAKQQAKIEILKRKSSGIQNRLVQFANPRSHELLATNEGILLSYSEGEKAKEAEVKKYSVFSMAHNPEASSSSELTPVPSQMIGGAAFVRGSFEEGTTKERKYLTNPSNPSEKFGYVFVLNRAEPAMRAIKATEELGLIPLVAASGPDAASLHVTWPTAHAIPIGGEAMKDSYGNVDKIRSALREIKRRQEVGLLEKTGVIVDPMWGGLSEDPILPRIIEEEAANLDLLVKFAGPSEFAMELFGPKVAANEIMTEAGFSIIPSSGEFSGTEVDLQKAEQEWKRLSKNGTIATIVKSNYGGGGKGQRRVAEELGLEKGLKAFRRAYLEAADEAGRIFGRREVLIQEEISDANHFELQCLADSHGNVRVAGIRFCSLQRGKQKLQEIDCTALFGKELLDQFFVPRVQKAMEIARKGDPRGRGYTGAFTIECLANLREAPSRKPWETDLTQLLFMEVNARLQVEHAVTEQANKVKTEEGFIDLDLEKEKIQIAAGLPISFRQDQVMPVAFGIEARLNAEDPFAFTPSPGMITYLGTPSHPWFRFDRGFQAGYKVPSEYDSLIGKGIIFQEVPETPTTSEEREKIWRAGYSRLHRAMREIQVAGIRTNKELHCALAQDERILSGNFDNQYVEREFLPSVKGRSLLPHWDVALLSTAVATYRRRQRKAIKSLNPQTEFSATSSVEMKVGGSSFVAEVSEAPQRNYYWVNINGNTVLVGHHESGPVHTVTLQGRNHPPLVIHSEQGKRIVTVGGVEHEVEVGGEGTLGEDHIVAPIPGKVVKISARPGDQVEEGQELIVVEAMKMENKIFAPKAGRIVEIRVQKGDSVEPNVSLGRLEFVSSDQASLSGEGKTSSLSEPKYLVTDPLVSTFLSTAGKDQQVTPPSLQAIRDLCQRSILGYDVPASFLKGAIGFLSPMAMSSAANREAVVVVLKELLNTLSLVQSLFHPRHEGQFKALLHKKEQGGSATPKEYIELLTGKEKADGSREEGVLKSYGVTSLQSSFELNEALYRLGMAHQRLPQIRESVKSLIELAYALQATELVPSLKRVQQSVIESGDSEGSIANHAEEIARALEAKDPARETGAQKFEGWFAQVSEGQKREAQEAIIASQYGINRYLIEKMGGEDLRHRELALDLLFRRLYGNGEQNGHKTKHIVESLESVSATTAFGTFRDHGNGRIRSVAWSVAQDNSKVSDAVSQARAILEAKRKITTGKVDDVIEILIPTPLTESPDSSDLARAIGQAMEGSHGFKRVTVAIGHQSQRGLEAPFYRTFRPDGPNGEFIHEPLDDDIHPIQAWRFERDRWDENFVLERVPFNTFPGIHAFRAQDRVSYEAGLVKAMVPLKGEETALAGWKSSLSAIYEKLRTRLQSSPSIPIPRILTNLLPTLSGGDSRVREAVQAKLEEAGKAGDKRNIIIAEVADATPLLFKADLPGRLEKILDKLNADPKAQLTEEELIAWRAIPWGLKSAGILPVDAEIFTIHTMMGNPRDLINLFGLNKAKVARAGDSLVGQVCSIPEAEQQSMNVAAAFNHIQHDRILSPKGPLDGRVDLFIWPPMDGVSNEALQYVIARSAHPFTHQRIDETHVHFTRGGKEEVAVVRISEHQLEIGVEEITARAPHRVFSRAQKIRMAREAAGSLHPYDRVELYRTSIHKFWPNGQAPKDAVRIQEMILGEDGELHDYQPIAISEEGKKGNLSSFKREPGENKVGKIVFKVDVQYAANPEGTEHFTQSFIELNDDYGIEAGSLGEKEADVHVAACNYAIRQGIPLRYLSEQAAGARIGFAKEIFRAVRQNIDTEGRWDAPGKWIFWATEVELARRISDPDTGQEVEYLRELVKVGEKVNFDGIEGYRITALYGSKQVKKPFVNTESLRGSERTARAMDEAVRYVPVMTTVPRRKGTASTVGIGVYNWVKGKFTQIVKGATAPLTGPRPVNENMATNYTSPEDFAGAKRLLEAGVALLGAENDLASADDFLAWLSFLPVGKDKKPAIIKTGDSPHRKVGEEIQALIPNAVTPYDVRNYLKIIYDQGFQGGLFEIGKDHGPAVVLALARRNGRPVLIIAPQPKPDPVSAESGRGPFFGATLDAESAKKVHRGIEFANLWKLPINIVSNFKGYSPAHWDVSRGVYLEGAEINGQLANSEQPIYQQTPPFGSEWGGVVATNGKQVNPEKTVIDVASNASRGILGEVGAIQTPVGGGRELELLINADPQMKALNTQIRLERDPAKRNRLIAQRAQLANQLDQDHYGPMLREFIKLGNTPDHAFNRGTIDGIYDPSDTRKRMIDAGELQDKQYDEEKIRKAHNLEADAIVKGWLESIRIVTQTAQTGLIQFEMGGKVYVGNSTVIHDALKAARGDKDYLKPKTVRKTLNDLYAVGQIRLLQKTG